MNIFTPVSLSWNSRRRSETSVLTGEVKVPEGMTGIGDYAFQDGGDYSTVYIPASVVDIDYNALSTGYSSSAKEISVICPAGSAMETFCKIREIPCTAQ